MSKIQFASFLVYRKDLGSICETNKQCSLMFLRDALVLVLLEELPIINSGGWELT
jgi:hypothetical protein